MGPIPAADVREAELPLVLDAGHVPIRARRLGLSLIAVALALSEGRMNKKAYARLEKLAEKCSETLKGNRNYFEIWRGDMWAIIGAHHDIQKAREKQQRTLTQPGAAGQE